MKNLGGEYLDMFSKNIVATFCNTFEKVVRNFNGILDFVKYVVCRFRWTQRRE